MIYALVAIFVALFGYIQVSDDINLPQIKDPKEQEIKYISDVEKKEAKEQYQRAKFNRNPSGYMTVEEYEELSAPKDKLAQNLKNLPT